MTQPRKPPFSQAKRRSTAPRKTRYVSGTKRRGRPTRGPGDPEDSPECRPGCPGVGAPPGWPGYRRPHPPPPPLAGSGADLGDPPAGPSPGVPPRPSLRASGPTEPRSPPARPAPLRPRGPSSPSAGGVHPRRPPPPFLASMVVASIPNASNESRPSRYPISIRRLQILSHTPRASHSFSLR